MYLTIKWKDDTQTNYKTLTIDRILDLGRAPDCHLSLEDKTVSRRHAIIYPYKKSVYLQNLSRTNKIWIDKSIPLSKGDSILLQEGVMFNIGRIQFTVTAVQTSQPEQALFTPWNILRSRTITPAPIFSTI